MPALDIWEQQVRLSRPLTSDQRLLVTYVMESLADLADVLAGRKEDHSGWIRRACCDFPEPEVEVGLDGTNCALVVENIVNIQSHEIRLHVLAAILPIFGRAIVFLGPDNRPPDPASN